jgi:sec-independent protein translocase protein TatA
MFGGIALPELIVFSLVILLLFGKRLPGVMRSMGQGIFEFKDALQNPDRHVTEQDA